MAIKVEFENLDELDVLLTYLEKAISNEMRYIAADHDLAEEDIDEEEIIKYNTDFDTALNIRDKLNDAYDENS